MKRQNEKNDDLYDVIIIGAGPAGSTAAYLLSKQGFRVLLADKKKFPRPKLCAGLITRKTTGIIEDIYGENVNTLKAQGAICHKTRNWVIFSKAKEIAKGRLNIPFHYVNRTVYDNFFLAKAKKAGTQVMEGERVVSVGIEKSYIKTDRGRILILYGQPNEIERHTNSMDTDPYEIWNYYSLDGGSEFIFADRNGFGRYELLHSSYYKELQNPNWYSLISISSDAISD